MGSVLKNRCLWAIVFACTLSVLLGSAAFAAGSSEKEKEAVKVTFWKAPHSAKEAELWAPIIGEFEQKHPKIKIEHVILGNLV